MRVVATAPEPLGPEPRRWRYAEDPETYKPPAHWGAPPIGIKVLPPRVNESERGYLERLDLLTTAEVSEPR
jgi:hypothetical protein